MKGSDVFWIIAIGVVTTVIGTIIADRLMSRGPARILPWPSTGSSGCGCGG